MGILRLAAVLVEFKFEIDLLLERISCLLLDLHHKTVPKVVSNRRRSVKCCHRMTVFIFEPHAGYIVREISVEVSDAAFSLMHRTICHPCQTLLEVIVV